MIKNSIIDTIGNTDLIKLNRISEIYNNNIFCKYEGSNPFGSIKDRVSYYIIKKAIEDNLINKDTVIIEATSGNTGIGLAAVGLYYGLKVIIVMPDNMSIERVNLLKAYKAQVILTEADKGMAYSIQVANELKSKYPNSFYPKQFENPNNPLIHYYTTAKEIYEDLDGNIDYIISTIGTGGTISGISKFMKEKNEDIQIVGCEPVESSVITAKLNSIDFVKSSHGIQGIGAGFIPDTLDISFIDEVITVSTNESYVASLELLTKEALLVGISSGAAFAALKKLVKEKKIVNKNIVFIIPDTGIKYISNYIDYFDEDK